MDVREGRSRLLTAERRMIIVGAAIVFTVVAALGPVYLRTQRRKLDRAAAAELTAIAELKVEQLRSWRSERAADVRRLVHIPGFAAALVALRQNTTSIAALNQLDAWTSGITDASGFGEPLLYTPDFEPITAAAADVSAGTGIKKLLEHALATRAVVISDFRAEKSGALDLDLATPVISRGGTVVGAALFRANPDRSLFPQLSRWPVPTQTGEILIGCREGSTLLYVARNGHVARVTAPPETAKARARANAGVYERRMDYRGIAVLGIRRAIPRSVWFIVAKLDQSQVYAPLRRDAAIVVWATVATLCALVAVAAFLWRRRKHIMLRQELEGQRRALAERKQVLAELRRSEEDHRLLFLSHPIPMWVIDVETLRFVAANTAATAHYGYSSEEFKRLTIADIQPRFDEVALRANFARPDFVRHNFGPVSHRKKNGEVILVQISGHAVTYASRPSRLVLAQDVTAQIEAERRLRESAELLDKANDAIVVTDLAGRVTFWNKGAERILGWTAAEAITRTGVQLFGFAAPPARAVDEATAARIYKMQVNRRSGDPAMLDVSVTLLRDEAGNPTGFLRIATDITEKQKLEDQFLRAQRLESIGMLAAGITHDLNNVLAPVAMAAGLLRLHITDPEHLRLIDTLDKCAARGAGLVRQILGFVHGISGEQRPVQVRYVMRDIANMIRETYPKSISFVEEAANDVTTIVGNPTQIHQVLLNLCVNARDAMPDGGALYLRARNEALNADAAAAVNTSGIGLPARPGEYVVLEVADTGTGIQPEVLANMWNPFYTTKSADKGTGLGLPTVRGIVEAHGGFIGVETEPGRGTSFRVYLPSVHTDEESSEKPGGDPLEHGHGELILLADDEEFVRETCRTVLTTAGYNVVLAKNGTEAAELFETLRGGVRLVITDHDMPGLDGDRLIQIIRHRVPRMHILAISGAEPDSQGTASAPVPQASAFLAKPFTPHALLRRVHELLLHAQQRNT